MADRPSIAAVIGLPPDQTVRAFDARDRLRTSVNWDEIWQQEHARFFTVAKVAKLDLLAELQASIADVLANGGTFQQWSDNLIPYLQKRGWWGKVQDAELTGTDQEVDVGLGRLRTIYDTNLRVSRGAGRWSQIQELKKERPYLMYVAVNDSHTRPLHRRWGGLDASQPIKIILPVDHPCWAIYFPPNGWGCRCTVRQLSERDLVRMGLSVTTDAQLRQIGWLGADGTPGGQTQTFVRNGSTQPVDVPIGVDPGFAYNAGMAAMSAIADKAIRSLEAVAPVNLDAARATLDQLVASDAFLEALNESGAKFPVMVLDPTTRAAIEADASVAVLSSDTYAKQVARHPELGVADYRALPLVGADPDIVAVEGDQVLNLARQQDGTWLVAIVKRTADKQKLFVTSVRRQNEASLPRLLRSARIVLDRRSGS